MVLRRASSLGLGDALVVVALLGFVYVLVAPLYRGSELGEREARVRARTTRVARLAAESGLLDAMAAISTAIQTDGTIEPFTRYYIGREALVFLPVYEDNAYYYRLRLDAGAARSGTLVEAEPRRPGASGRFGYGCDGRGVVDQRPVLSDRLLEDLDVERHETLAQERCKKISAIAVDADLPKAIARFSSALEAEFGVPCAATVEGCLDLRVDGYRFRCWPIFEDVAGATTMSLECLAWPEGIGETGFATFRVAGRGEVLQTRNLVRPYDGRAERNVPKPGAGLPRNPIDAAGAEYMGVDGNHWFKARSYDAP